MDGYLYYICVVIIFYLMFQVGAYEDCCAVVEFFTAVDLVSIISKYLYFFFCFEPVGIDKY